MSFHIYYVVQLIILSKTKFNLLSQIILGMRKVPLRNKLRKRLTQITLSKLLIMDKLLIMELSKKKLLIRDK
jgi:hypothetical protein